MGARSNRIKLLIFSTPLILCALFSCSDKATNKAKEKMPLPGSDSLAQVVFIVERHRNYDWPPPGPKEQEDIAGMQFKIIPLDITDGESVLREWNARSIDILVLYPELPQKLWHQLQLPRLQKRRILALNSDKTVEAADWHVVQISQPSIDKLISAVCAPSLPWKCGSSPGQLKIGPKPQSPHIQLSINWHSFFQRLQNLSSSQALNIDFRSGFLQIYLEEKSLPINIDRNLLNSALNKWRFEALSQ